MRYASVCDGIGAAHVAWQPLGWQCQWTSEIEPFPAAVVEHHYGFRNLGDMTAITEEMLDAPVDLLVGGTPCQSFSVAGLRGGLADPRGNLALRFVQLAAVMQPRWIVWENVPGVLSSGKGRDFGTFLGALAELGYGFAHRILDAQWFGVAQRRRRVFVVAHLGDWRRAAAVLFERESVFGNPPTREAAGQDAAGSTGNGVARCVTSGESKRQDWETCNFVAETLNASGKGVERCGESRGQDDVVLAAPQVVAFGGQMSTPQVDVELSQTLQRKNPQAVTVAFTAKDCGGDAAQDVAPTMRAMGHSVSHANGGGQLAVAVRTAQTSANGHGVASEVAHTLDQVQGQATPFTKSKRAQSTTDDETWVPGEVSPTMSCFDQGDTRATTVVAFKPSHYTRGKDGAPSEVTAPLSADADNGDQDTVVAFAQNQLGEVRTNAEIMGTVNTNQNASGRNTPMVQQAMAVRRLTPRECERLQGFPDDYTLVTYRNKPAADGPRYRALGNSMAVPVMRWIGERIAMVHKL